MSVRIVYAVRMCTGDGGNHWLLDTCAGGAWTLAHNEAKTWPRRQELVDELAATEIVQEHEGYLLEVVELVEATR